MSKNKESSEGEENVDQDFLDQVLNQLYDFGDGAKNRKTKKSQKKKKKITHEEEAEESASNDTLTNSVIIFEDRDESLYSKNSVQIDSTKAETSTLATKHSDVPVVVFEDPLKKQRTKPQIEMTERKEDGKEVKPPEMKKRKTEEEDEFSIEKARLEVHRFGITGYKKDQQRVFEQDRAIMLGAMPPKKEYVNYKHYQQMIKEKKQKEEEEAKGDKSKNKRKEGKPRDKKPRPMSSGEPSGQIGRFKGGVLVLNSKQLQAMNGKIKKSK
ncbi:uncharacterized protein C1orf131 homolog [Alosa sapidissima]|uniref:uncharacterized protein C1orf131 homolog n=1 Tax=Alosa sapidissima TaxID=34773 RepID=UPI001C097582|nr:uncharacterized protein C1orf131 homolog [Alosa sapidissima]